MGIIRASIRFIIIFLTLFFGLFVVWILSLFPLKYRGVRLTIWTTTILCRIINFTLNVKVKFDNPAHIANFDGFIFANHTSFLDILVLLGAQPVRFLSMAELASWPIIGNMARAIDCVFVDRSSKASRQAARESLKGVAKSPPIIIFPEGGIKPPPTEIKELRYGAFDIAIGTNSAFMPVVLVYEDPSLVFWTDTNTLRVAWNFCQHNNRINVQICPLAAVQPQPGDTSEQLALQTRASMARVLASGRQSVPDSP